MASARRLGFAIAPTPFDPRLLRRAIDADREGVVAAFAHEPTADWEREVFAASEFDRDAQAAAMNEALSEIDFRLARWGRVPRVCASIASSTGFLCGAMALRAGLADVDMVSDAAIDAALHGAVGHALGVAAFGLAGAVACVALDSEARKALKSRRLGADLLVERLERKGSSGAGGEPAEETE